MNLELQMSTGLQEMTPPRVLPQHPVCLPRLAILRVPLSSLLILGRSKLVLPLSVLTLAESNSPPRKKQGLGN